MIYDLIIIGGGPAGAAAAVYTARKKLKAVIITDNFGGQSIVSDDIQNWIGEARISGVELAKKFETHIRAQIGIEIFTGDKVSQITKTESVFEISTESGKKMEANAILIAAGARRRKLNVPGEENFSGKGVAYCATCDAPLFAGRTVAVVGGGNAGLESALDLESYAEKIFILEKTDTLRGDEVTLEKVKNSPKMEVIFGAEVTEIFGDKMVSGLKYRQLSSGEIKELKVDGVFVEIGSMPNSDLVKNLVEINARGEIVVDQKTQAASTPGIWAAGDAADGLYKQNNVAAGDAIKAVLNISEYLRKKSD